MEQHLVITLVVITGLGIAAQWLAWYWRIPVIVILIAFGLLAGPLFGWIDPGRDLGRLLDPIIALGTAVILFEGGMNLELHELRQTGVTVNRLIGMGIPLTWLLSTAAAFYVGNLSWPVAVLFGAIMVATGPTVMMPILRYARLQRQTAAMLKWEGIITDPLGALLAVMVYEYYIPSPAESSLPEVAGRLGLGLTAALALGAAVGYGLGQAFRRRLVPEFLQAPVLLVTVLAAYVLANLVQREAGLLAATLAGVIIANRHLRNIDELRRFKQYMTILLVSAVFILLTADIDFEVVRHLSWSGAALLALLVFVVRPVSVYLSTIGAGMSWQQRLLLAWAAPRGIVAAAMAGLFAPRFMEQHYDGAQLLVPLVFALIVVTVALHGLTIGALARRLKLASLNPNGVLIVGASPWSVELGQSLHELGVPVLISDSSWHRLQPARMAGLRIHHGQILSELAEASLELNDISRLLAVTPNDAYNALVCTRFAPELGGTNVYQLAGRSHEEDRGSAELAPTVRSTVAFEEDTRYEDLMRAHYRGWESRKTRLAEDYAHDDFLRGHPTEDIRIGVLRGSGVFDLYPLPQGQGPQPGNTIVHYLRHPHAPRQQPA